MKNWYLVSMLCASLDGKSDRVVRCWYKFNGPVSPLDVVHNYVCDFIEYINCSAFQLSDIVPLTLEVYRSGVPSFVSVECIYRESQPDVYFYAVYGCPFSGLLLSLVRQRVAGALAPVTRTAVVESFIEDNYKEVLEDAR